MATETRFIALDVLRGLAVAGMILVVSPGDWGAVYAPLRHAAWDGWTLADMVFPTFLFAVGAALGLSFPRRWDASARRTFRRRVLRRVGALILLGLLVEASYVWAIAAGAPAPGVGDLAHLRIPGILQRIGLCYGLAAGAIVVTGRIEGDRLILRVSSVALLAVAALLSYYLLLTFVPVPGFGAGRLDPVGTLPAYLDRALFGTAHLWPLGVATPGGPVVYDPEGLLATLPATVNVLAGAMATALWRRLSSRGVTIVVLGGIVAVVAAAIIDPLFPINKSIWTSSFALLSAGVSALALVAVAALIRQRALAPLALPFRVLGGNAILAFLLSTALSRLAGFALIPDRGGWVTPQAWGFGIASRLVADPPLASLLCALGIVGIVTIMLWPLHRRAIYIRL